MWIPSLSCQVFSVLINSTKKNHWEEEVDVECLLSTSWVGLDLAKKMDSRYFCTVNPKEGVMSKRFSEQFKQEAVQLVSAERPIRQVASYLGIGYSTLDKWVRAHRERTGQLVALTQEQKRIRELERQVAHLQEVNDILKKATVYFANPANR